MYSTYMYDDALRPICVLSNQLSTALR